MSINKKHIVLVISVLILGMLLILFLSFKKKNFKAEINRDLPGFYDIPLEEMFKNEDHKIDKDIQNIIKNYFQTFWIDNQLSGGFLIAKGNQIIYENYVGFANFEKQILLKNNTAIQTASITKNLTAMAILKLVEANQLKLIHPVKKYLIHFPYPNITILDLLTHRSGLSEYGYFAEEAGIWQKEEQYLTNQMVLDLYIKHKPAPYTPPNKNFSYCNTNYAFLALIIEKITKKDYPTAMKMMIFDPLDMKATYVFEKKHFKTASLSYFNNGKLHPWDFRDLVYGDKNIYSTPRDLLKYSQAMFSEKFLRQTLKDSAMIGYSNERKGMKNYGLGFRIYHFDNGKKITYHNGWWHGNNTTFVHLPDEKITIIALGNKKSRHVYSAYSLAGLFGDYPISIKFEENDLYISDSISFSFKKIVKSDSLKFKKSVINNERLTTNDSVNE